MDTQRRAQVDREAANLSEIAYSTLGDRVVALAEQICGEALDDRVQAVHVAMNEAGFDPFGFDPRVARYAFAMGALLHRRYFRTQTFGLENIPQGRMLLVSNHSGQVPLDGLAICMALMLDRDPPIFPRSMVERWTAELPVVSWLFPRLGQVLGAPDNARRLLRDGQALMVFPEGARGITKPFSRRYQLERFGSGFMRLALETETPIVPVAVIGAEEQYPSLTNLTGLAKRLGLPALPVIPQLAFGVVLPLPVRYRVYFGKPLFVHGDADDDDDTMDRQVLQVKAAVRELIDRGLAERAGVFW